MDSDPSLQLVPNNSGDTLQPPAQELGERLRSIAAQRVWLPRLFYENLPLLYILMGAGAVVSTLFNQHWSWLLPHLGLLGCFLVHLGIMVHRARRRARSPAAPPRT